MDLAYETRGSGQPIAFLHGVGHDRRAWDPIQDRVGGERLMVLVDLPGHGASPLPVSSAGLGVERLTDLVQEFGRAAGFGDVPVVGNSLGAAIALELVRRGASPSRLAIAPIGFWSPAEVRYAATVLRTSQALARALRPALPRLLSLGPARQATMFPYFGKPSRLAPEEATSAAQSFADAVGVAAILPHSTRYRFDPDGIDASRVTIAWGDHDRLLIGGQANRARRLLPQARFVVLRDAGHVPMSDAPAAVADLVLVL